MNGINFTQQIEGDEGESETLNVGSLNTPEIPLFSVFVKPNAAYKGEYGFDWMRLGADTLDTEDFRTISEDFHLLEKEYDELEIEKGVKYYVPWLCMFPDHKTIIGKDVKFLLHLDPTKVDNKFLGDDEIKLIPSNESITITPNKFSIDQIMMGSALITIECTSPLSSNEHIDIKLEATVLNDPNGKSVGKINILKNDHYKELEINVDVVYSYLIKEPNFDITSVESDINSTGGLSAIEKYLNTESLNQALIQVKLHYKTNVEKYNWAFRKSTLELVNDGKDPQDGKASYLYQKYKGLIQNKTTMEVDSSKYTQYINDRYATMGGMNKKRIRLYMSSLRSVDAGGMAYVVPLDNIHCIVFKNNLTNKSTHAHELAHTLGLYHTFQEKNNSGIKLNIEQWIAIYEPLIDNEITNINNKKQAHLSTNAAYFNVNPNNLKTDPYLKDYDKQIIRWNKIKTDYAPSMRKDNHKFIQGNTTNIMDYTSQRIYFYKRQWEIMQEEIKRYYYEK